MSDSTSVIRAVIIYGIVLPLAILLGCMLVNLPYMDRSSMVVIGIIAAVLCAPFLLRWHHLLLFVSWNIPALIFFLPGSPEFWIFMALTSFIITITQRALDPGVRMFPVPSVLWPLLFILAVVLGTAHLNGGIHLSSFGGGDVMGGKRYVYMIAAVMGFLAMTSHPIPLAKAPLFAGGFLLGNVANIISNLAPYLGSVIPILFYIFPADMNTYGAVSQDTSSDAVTRNFGLSFSLCWAFLYLLARYGIKQLLSSGNLKKLTLAVLLFVGGLVGGFRSFLLMMLITGFFLFWIEGLFRSRYMLLVMGAFAATLLLLPFAKSLPLPIQRAMTVLPVVEVDPAVRREAEGSSEWRIRMWKTLLPEVPKYLWLGKGLGINAAEYWTEVNLSKQSRGGEDAITFMMAGDYHNGPLSVIIPFGIWGVLGWFWFLAAAIRLLYLNQRHGDPALQTINRFLFAHFLAKIIIFFFVFGGFYSDFAMFAGIAGLSISLNGGIRKSSPASVRTAKPAPRRLRFPARLAPGH